MELVLFVCLISAPQQCREEVLGMGAEPARQLACMWSAVPIIAQWSGTHPKWRVARWRCSLPEIEGRKA